ncbi:unnamed protein product [Withania somnifera]
MASKGITIIFMALVVIMSMISVQMVMAQSDCTSTLITMASCLSFVTGSAKTPSTSCCSALSGVLQSNPRCLCVIVNGGGSSLGVQINQTQALALPSACNLQTPPVSKCYEGAPTKELCILRYKFITGSSSTSNGSSLKVSFGAVVAIFLFTTSYFFMI